MFADVSHLTAEFFCATIFVVLPRHLAIDASRRHTIENVPFAADVAILARELQLQDVPQHAFDDIMSFQLQRDPGLDAQGLPSEDA